MDTVFVEMKKVLSGLKAFRKSLLTRVKRDFSPLEYTTITAQMDDLDALHRQYNTEVENRERRSDHDGVLLRRYS